MTPIKISNSSNDNRHTVVIETIKTVKQRHYILDEHGNKQYNKRGSPKTMFTTSEEVLDSKEEKFFSIYNAEARAEIINMDINPYRETNVRARVIKAGA